MQPSWISNLKDIYKLPRYNLPSFQSIALLVQEKCKIYFKDIKITQTSAVAKLVEHQLCDWKVMVQEMKRKIDFQNDSHL